MMAETGSAQWGRVILIYLIGVFGMLVVSAAVPALGGIAAEFHPESPSIIGWVMSSPALAAVLASLVIGGCVDRFGDRTVMLIGGLVVLAGDAGVISADGLTPLLAWRVVSGLGYVCMVVAAVTMIVRLTQGRQRIAALALWSTVIPASFVAASAYGALLGHGAPWRFAFLAHAGGTALLTLLALLLLPGRAQGDVAVSRLSGIGQVLRSPAPYVLGFSFAAAAFLQTGVVATLPGILGMSIGSSEAQVHSFNIIAMLCNMIGAWSVGLMLNRGLRAKLIGSCGVVLCALAGAGLLIAPTGLLPAMAMNCALMFGLGILVGMWALLPLAAPTPASMGATSGLITQITVLGVLFGPPLAFKALAGGTGGLLTFLALALIGSMVGWPIWAKSAGGGAKAPVAH